MLQGALIAVAARAKEAKAAAGSAVGEIRDALDNPNYHDHEDEEAWSDEYKNEKFSIVAGAIEGSILSMAEIKKLTEHPSFDGVRAKIVGLLQAPARNLVGVLPATGAKIARVLSARSQQG